MNFFSYTESWMTDGGPLNKDSQFLSWHLPSMSVFSGSGYLNRTKLPHDAGAFGPLVLVNLTGAVLTLSNVLAFEVKGALDRARLSRRREYTVRLNDPPGEVRFFKSSNSTCINAMNL